MKMSEVPELTKAELMDHMGSNWLALQTALDQLSMEQMAEAKDAAGWAVKDHLMHLAAWERSMLFLLRGEPRYEGLGISKDLFLNGSEEAINNAIYKHYANLPPQEALKELRDVHEQMMALLQTLPEADLYKPYGAYAGDEGAKDGPPVINYINGNSAEHYAEHLPWIEALVSEESCG
jgi:hypothetical protein